MFKKLFKIFVITAFLISSSGFNPSMLEAAQLTGVSDTMSTQVKNANSDHTFRWTLVGNSTLAAGDTVSVGIKANATDFTVNAAGSWQTTDFSLLDTNHATIAPLAVGAGPSCTATDNYTVTINPTSTTATFVITTCSGWVASAANASITFAVKGATGGTGTITNKNADVNSSVFSITNSGSNVHAASGAIVVEDNALVNITAEVAPTLTFANDDASIGFGTLTSGGARYATANTSGSGSSTVAHTFSISTNATAGYTLSYNGPTLTSAGNTIAPATITGSATGTPGSAQFALTNAVTGSGTPDRKSVV